MGSDGMVERKGDRSALRMRGHISRERRPRGGKGGWTGHRTALLITLSPLHVLLPEQAREAAGQLLRWKGDVDQDGSLLLKSVFVLTGTNAVSVGPRGPQLGSSVSTCGRKSQQRQWHISRVSFLL